jgi:hypothetical protein
MAKMYRAVITNKGLLLSRALMLICLPRRYLARDSRRCRLGEMRILEQLSRLLDTAQYHGALATSRLYSLTVASSSASSRWTVRSLAMSSSTPSIASVTVQLQCLASMSFAIEGPTYGQR